jgi:hypothetical protein
MTERNITVESQKVSVAYPVPELSQPTSSPRSERPSARVQNKNGSERYPVVLGIVRPYEMVLRSRRNPLQSLVLWLKFLDPEESDQSSSLIVACIPAGSGEVLPVDQALSERLSLLSGPQRPSYEECNDLLRKIDELILQCRP